MTIFTHVVFAGILGGAFNASNENLTFMMVGSFLPDIDNPKSVLGRTLFFISEPIYQRFDHRRFIHSIFLWMILYAAALFFFPAISFLFLGAISHILIDCMSLKGVQIFQPFSEVVAVLFPRRYRIPVGSRQEFAILLFMVILMSGVFYVRAQGGPVMMLTKFVGSYQTALQQYEMAGTDVCFISGKLRYKNGVIENKKWMVIGLEHGDGLALLDSEKSGLIHVPQDAFFLKANLEKTNQKWNFLSVKKPSVLEVGTCFFMFDNRWHRLKTGGSFQGEVSYLGELQLK